MGESTSEQLLCVHGVLSYRVTGQMMKCHATLIFATLVNSEKLHLHKFPTALYIKFSVLIDIYSKVYYVYYDNIYIYQIVTLH